MGFRPSKKTPERSYGKSAVMSEAMARKDGGKIPFKKGGQCKADGGEVKKATGGAVDMKVEGKKSGGRVDKFARGGRAGCEKNPFSGAKID